MYVNLLGVHMRMILHGYDLPSQADEVGLGLWLAQRHAVQYWRSLRVR